LFVSHNQHVQVYGKYSVAVIN